MKKGWIWLCVCAMLCLMSAPVAKAERQVYNGEGFSLFFPEEWIDLYEVEEGEAYDPAELAPGEEEALFTSLDNLISVSILRADFAQQDIALLMERITEDRMEADVANIPSYQKIGYYGEPARQRALIAYSHVQEGQPVISYTVYFISAADALQIFTVTIDQMEQERLMPILTQVINSLDSGELSEGAEG